MKGKPAVLISRYVDDGTPNSVLENCVRAGAKGTGKVLFRHRYWDNARAAEEAEVALSAWIRNHPEWAVNTLPDLD